MTDREAMQQALDALELLARYENPATKVQVRKPRNGGPIVTMYPHKVATEAAAPLRERLAQPEQEFTTHEEGKDGWSDWVCPDPQSYLMKCCDCGLVHEAQFGVVRYTDTAEKENCDMVDDPNLQAVFRMRRSEQWTPKDTAYRPGGLAQPEQEPVSGVVLDEHGLGALVKNGSEDWHCKNRNARRLYTTPPQGIYYTPPQRTWVGLTDEQIRDLWSWSMTAEAERTANTQQHAFARAIEAKLKEKNT